MSESNYTAPAPSGKPAKPSPDFPLFPHATRRWAKKIKGKMFYFGRWDDPEGALREYEAFLAGKPVDKSRRVEPVEGRPAKPYPEFPLLPHAAGVWAKKIRGKLYDFGPWNDPDGALAKYLAQKDDLHAGRTPRADPQELTVKDVANDFLNAKKQALDAGELSPRTWADYKSIMEMLVSGLGQGRLVSDLAPDDFTALKGTLSKRNGPARMSTVVQVICCAFKHVYESGKTDRPMRFGPQFKRTSKKTLRLHRATQGAKLFTADEVRQLIGAAGIPVKAMLLLGINCGFGNSDVGNLPRAAVDLDAGMVDFPRPKTGLPRRCPLWPQTTEALKEALAKRPTPKDAEHAGLVFVTKYGQSWAKSDSSGPLVLETRKLLKKLGINGHKGLGLYTLRHVFRTIADEARDQPAADYIIGHEVQHMSSVYRETISDARLKAVSDHVRGWLFPAPEQLKVATQHADGGDTGRSES